MKTLLSIALSLALSSLLLIQSAAIAESMLEADIPALSNGESETVEISAEASELQAILKKYTRLSANFTQDIIEQDGYLLDSYDGAIKLERPNRINWRVEPPLNQLLIADGETIYLYDPDLLQVTIRPWSNDPSINPGVLLAGDMQLAEYFSVEKVEEGSFLMTAIQQGSVVEQIAMLFDGDIPSEFSIIDSLGQTTKMVFSDVIIDSEFEPNTFQFELPEGVELFYAN